MGRLDEWESVREMSVCIFRSYRSSSFDRCYCGEEYKFGKGVYVPDSQCDKPCHGKSNFLGIA